MTTHAVKLPYEIGRFSLGWKALIFVLFVLAGVGAYAYNLQLTQGEAVTGLRDIGTMGGATWGLYVVFVVYFVGVSFAGITVAALIRLLNLTHLRPVARIAELLTVVALIVGGLSILVDVGQPLRAIVNLPRYARPGSPFFGTFTLVISGYLFASLVYLYLDCRRDAYVMAQRPGRLQGVYRWLAAGYQDSEDERARHRQTTFWLALAVLPLLIVATSTLGFVFGLQVGRPGWFGALQGPAFVVLAGVSGVGLLILITAALRSLAGLREQLNMTVFRWLGNFLMGLTAVYLYFIVVESLTAVYQSSAADEIVNEALLRGTYAPIFWTSIAFLAVSFALLLLQFVRRSYHLGWLVLAGILVNLAALGKRFLIVVPSQTHGSSLPYAVGAYSPTLVEYGVITGLVALGVLLFVLFAKLFPIMEIAPAATVEKITPPSDRRRSGLAWTLVAGGFALQIVAYFFLATPLGPPTSVAFSDPRLPFAPVLFIIGVMVVFAAALVYELLPEAERSSA